MRQVDIEKKQCKGGSERQHLQNTRHSSVRGAGHSRLAAWALDLHLKTLMTNLETVHRLDGHQSRLGIVITHETCQMGFEISEVGENEKVGHRGAYWHAEKKKRKRVLNDTSRYSFQPTEALAETSILINEYFGTNNLAKRHKGGGQSEVIELRWEMVDEKIGAIRSTCY